MNIFNWGLLTVFLCFQANVHAQKLKRADRQIVANLESHMKHLDAGRGAQAKAQYVAGQFAKYGLKPLGDSNSYFQRFVIYEGKEIGASTSLSLNGKKLKLHHDYFPFAFSANKSTEAAVAIALAENGVPWFKDISEMLESEDGTASTDTSEIIRKKAILAAEKGASALIVYSSQGTADLMYNKFDESQQVSIPVIYLNNKVFTECCSDEAAIVDVSLTVNLQPKTRTGVNVVGFADNRADSTSLAAASADSTQYAAALIEVVRLTKAGKSKKNNYLFITRCEDTNREPGQVRLKHHPAVDSSKINHTVNLDMVTIADDNRKGLHLVKQSIDLLKN